MLPFVTRRIVPRFHHSLCISSHHRDFGVVQLAASRVGPIARPAGGGRAWIETSYFPAPALRALLVDLDLGRSRVELGVHARVELRLQLHALGSALLVFAAAGGQPVVSVVPLLQGDLALERLAHLGQEAGEVELLPGGDLLVQGRAGCAQGGQERHHRSDAIIPDRSWIPQPTLPRDCREESTETNRERPGPASSDT